jgi:orotate phosphoribosyltransferase-like protein
MLNSRVAAVLAELGMSEEEIARRQNVSVEEVRSVLSAVKKAERNKRSAAIRRDLRAKQKKT